MSDDEAILAHPEQIPEDVSVLDFESLLSIAQDAYEKKTGEEYDHVPKPDYETFSNKEGWP